MPNNNLPIDLLNGKIVAPSLFNSVHKHILERVPYLEECTPYLLKMICDDQYWDGLRGLKTQAGWIMTHLVESELVPFDFASPRDEKPLWYRLNNRH